MKVLFAVKIGDADWQEQLITEQSEHIKAASDWALANGFDRLRVVDIDLNMDAAQFGAHMINAVAGKIIGGRA